MSDGFIAAMYVFLALLSIPVGIAIPFLLYPIAGAAGGIMAIEIRRLRRG